MPPVRKPKASGSGVKPPKERNVPELAKTVKKQKRKKNTTLLSSRFLTPPPNFKSMLTTPEPECSTSYSTHSRSKNEMPPESTPQASESGRKKPVEKNFPEFAKTPKKRTSRKKTPYSGYRPPRLTYKSVLNSRLDESECSTSYSTPSGSKKEKVCAFYRTSTGPNGETVFSKSLLKHFLKVDSPAWDEFKKKKKRKFKEGEYEAYLRSRGITKEDLQIFTEEELNDPKFFEDIPGVRKFPEIRKRSIELPEVPGTLYAKIFENVPIDTYDEEKPKSKAGGENDEKSMKKGKKGFECTTKSKKPRKITNIKRTRKSFVLPEENWGFNYGDLFNSPSKSDSDEDCANNLFGDFFKTPSKSDLNDNGAKNDDKEIEETSVDLKSLQGYKFLSHTKEEELILNKYKDLLGNRQCFVILSRVPYDPNLVAKSSYDDKSHAKPNVVIIKKK